MQKECTQHQSSSSSSSSPGTKLGPHMVGFLSVLVISGSVALISFMGKNKLMRLGGGQATWLTHSQAHDDEEEAHSHSQEEEKLHAHSHSDSSCEENEHSPTHLKNLHEGHEPTRAPIKKKKKVRFASDVVEPPCNGQQYRRVSQECEKHEPSCNDQVLEPPSNHHQHYKLKQRVSHRCGVDKPSCNDHVDVDESPSARNVSQEHTTRTHLEHPKMPSTRKISRGCEMHARSSQHQVSPKSSSSIPANRLALYKGLRQSQLEHSLHRL